MSYKGRAKKEDKLEKINHEHSFKAMGFFDEERCSCGAIKVSQKEYQRRWDAWENYYAECKQSPSFIRFIDMKEAIKMGDREKIQELMAESKRVMENKDYVVLEKKPKFPDPMNPHRSHYIVSN